ncbi:Laccase [Lachnellula suecica]|uniref:laccase n=1 Tax=Lachnellula suecica TaxID=602035 RepID=A0A8T9CHL1_9HELO|nr:Laccase [Lachnellula suecica]
MSFFKLLLVALFSSFVTGAVLPEARLQERQSCNSATDRACWSSGYSIATDSETSWPNTGVTVKYTLDISQKTLAPDGTSKTMFVVNGQYPGPTITANWGDFLEITVTNSMTTNGTSMHWHGIVQKNTNNMDGVNGVTECPIPPGGSKTYLFQATEHGTSWYHSHYSFQYGDGVVGPIVINGPASANYDVDLGPMPISDIFYNQMYAEYVLSLTGGPPVAPNAVINGTMRNPANGLNYRLRLINTAVDSGWYVSLDSHIFTVIAADFVPVVPFNTTWLFIAIGQRYDVIITASATASNYWFRAENGCGNNGNQANIRSIFHYDTVAAGNPSSTSATLPTFSCTDQTGIVPYVAKSVPAISLFDSSDNLNIAAGQGGTWTINTQAIDIAWGSPTLLAVEQGATTFAAATNTYELPDANVWVYWVVQNGGGVSHPIHLHGHDFSLLGSGSGTFTNATASVLNFATPVRRDVSELPGGGWIVIAFQTDNPGAWLHPTLMRRTVHCHIVWHVGAGLALQFLERASEIPTTMDLSSLPSRCDAWDAYYSTTPDTQLDSGL